MREGPIREETCDFVRAGAGIAVAVELGGNVKLRGMEGVVGAAIVGGTAGGGENVSPVCAEPDDVGLENSSHSSSLKVDLEGVVLEATW